MTSTENKIFKKILWKVSDLSEEAIRNYEAGKKIESPPFTIQLGGNVLTWELVVYPNGNQIEPYLGIFMKLINAGSRKFDAKIKFGVSGKTQTEDHFTRKMKKSGEDFRGTLGKGFYKCIRHDDFFKKKSQLFENDVFTIICELTLSAPKISSEELDQLHVSDFRKMFENEVFVDFELKTNDGVTLKAHKVILSARSPVFYAMLTKDMQEANEGSVNIPDFDSLVMKEALRFIYYKEVENIHEIAPALVYAAEKYQLEGLKRLCIDTISATLSLENVMKLLVIADHTNDENFFDNCLDLLISNPQILRETNELKNLSKELMAKIIKGQIGGHNEIHI